MKEYFGRLQAYFTPSLLEGILAIL